MPFCGRCGKPNPADAIFCNYCGNQIRVPDSTFESTSLYRIVHLKHEYCGGTGIDYHSGPMGIRCRTCEGTGSVSIKVESTERLVKCPVCEGSGVNDANSLIGIECKRCHGTGQIPQKILTY